MTAVDQAYGLALESALDGEAVCTAPECGLPAEAVAALTCCGVSSRIGCAAHIDRAIRRMKARLQIPSHCANCYALIGPGHVIVRLI